MSEAGGGDLAEFLSILSNIEASGILTIKKEKVSRDSKVLTCKPVYFLPIPFTCLFD